MNTLVNYGKSTQHNSIQQLKKYTKIVNINKERLTILKDRQHLVWITLGFVLRLENVRSIHIPNICNSPLLIYLWIITMYYFIIFKMSILQVVEEYLMM